MRPIDELGEAEARALSGLAFDLDDTFLDRGRLIEAAYSSLFRLNEAKVALLVVTGRPAAWGDLLVRQWPILGAVTENGAIALRLEHGHVVRLDRIDARARQVRRRELDAIVAALRARLPELTPADDSQQRISDYTFDIGERRSAPPALVDDAIEYARERGAVTWRSSVHLHVTLDRDDKASGAVRALRELAGLDATRARFRWAFIGDSENDESCFAAFPTSIAVANLSGRPTLRPRYVTRSARSQGFVEAASVLLARRASV
jgi:HAD superfamily hydrolase (TIGR01484 family)